MGKATHNLDYQEIHQKIPFTPINQAKIKQGKFYKDI